MPYLMTATAVTTTNQIVREYIFMLRTRDTIQHYFLPTKLSTINVLVFFFIFFLLKIKVYAQRQICWAKITTTTGFLSMFLSRLLTVINTKEKTTMKSLALTMMPT